MFASQKERKVTMLPLHQAAFSWLVVSVRSPSGEPYALRTRDNIGGSYGNRTRYIRSTIWYVSRYTNEPIKSSGRFPLPCYLTLNAAGSSITTFAPVWNTSFFVLFLSNILAIILVITTAKTNFMIASFSFIPAKNKKPGQFFNPTGPA